MIGTDYLIEWLATETPAHPPVGTWRPREGARPSAYNQGRRAVHACPDCLVNIRQTNRRAERAAIVALACLAAGCAAGRPVMVTSPGLGQAAPCRTPAHADGSRSSHRITWTAPSAPADRLRLDAWCDTTGPPVIEPRPAATAPGRPNELVVVSWNVHGGAADLASLIRRLEAGALTDGVPASRFVLLLQEAPRAGGYVPHSVRGVRVPRAIRGRGNTRRIDVLEFARARGLAVYYVPSMRNGSSDESNEDRGNAILSTEPLSAFEAIELPFVRQRRVAIAATVSGDDVSGTPWSVRVVSAHLDNLASRRRLWIAAAGTRVRQARGLVDALGRHRALVIGGDFNTWFGFADPAYRTIAGAVPDAAAGDRRPTFGPLLRLDHLFARLPLGWTVRASRLDERLGSDHHALVARVRLAGALARAGAR